MIATTRTIAALAALPLLLGSCASAYYATMETFGVHKREILVDRVEKGRADQEDAKQQFVSTLDAMKRLTGLRGGDLEEIYEHLKDELEECEDDAEDVRDRIESIDGVAGDLFEEWEEELADISNPDLRRRSERMLTDTRSRYRKLIGAMKRAESRMEPVLVAFRDHVLFLKHNLNARAIASLDETVVSIEADVEALVLDMRAAIEEADAFIAAMGT